MRYRWFVSLGLVVSAGCMRSPETALVRDAAEAMGGASKVAAVEVLTLEGEGEAFNFGQGKSPDGELPKFTVTELRRVIDFKDSRWRQEALRTPTFVTANPPAKQILGVEKDVAYNVSPAGAATRATARTAKDRTAELYHHPIGILREALGTEANLKNVRKEGALGVVDVSTPSGATYTLYIDETTKLPAKVVSKTSNPVLGDVLMETEFSDYSETDGLKLPSVITSRLDGEVTAVTRVTRTTIGGDPGDLAAPADAASAASDPPAAIEATEVAKGIWYLTGQTHHSVVAEFSDHLVLIEAPSEARTLAVIAKARELVPGKPLTHAVLTHHHFDHSGGIRAAVSEGLTIIAHADASKFVEDVVGRKFEIEPDALAKNPKPLVIQAVEGEMLLKDDAMSIGLYPVDGSPHADTLLMAHFPKEGFLVQADLYSPPAPNAPPPAGYPFAPNLVENVTGRKLKVENVLPIHGRMVPMKALMDAAAPAPAATSE
jgi:glyoxylase-like metal-dependent hydrolase (beta-lactamase superfamily II)